MNAEDAIWTSSVAENVEFDSANTAPPDPALVQFSKVDKFIVSAASSICSYPFLYVETHIAPPFFLAEQFTKTDLIIFT